MFRRQCWTIARSMISGSCTKFLQPSSSSLALCWRSVMLFSAAMLSCGELLLLTNVAAAQQSDTETRPSKNTSRPRMVVKASEDFQITGRGDAEAWSQTEWVPLNARPGHQHSYAARIKMLYSAKGLYVLFDGTDSRLTATMTEDFDDLWNEDVYECFFWTNEEHPVYFEYEISPLGYELPILVPKLDGRFLGWRPWHYDGDRRTQKKVSVTGGEQMSMARVSGWTAEVFIPYELLRPLSNVPPKSGTKWRANFYRMDYDEQQKSAWDWARVGPSFHEIEKFGTLVFE